MVEGPGCTSNGEKLQKLRNQVIRAILLELQDSQPKLRDKARQCEGCEVTEVFTVGKELFIIIKPLSNALHNLFVAKENGDDGEEEGSSFKGIALRLHFGMQGHIRLNNTSARSPTLPNLILNCNKSTVYTYDTDVDFKTLTYAETVRTRRTRDVMAKCFDFNDASERVRRDKRLICDVAMDQTVLPGVGNMIKVEGLFHSGVNPLRQADSLSAEETLLLLKELRKFAKFMYDLDRKSKALAPFMKVYNKKTCVVCSERVVVVREGHLKRLSYFCPRCQPKNPTPQTRENQTQPSGAGGPDTETRGGVVREQGTHRGVSGREDEVMRQQKGGERSKKDNVNAKGGGDLVQLFARQKRRQEEMTASSFSSSSSFCPFQSAPPVCQPSSSSSSVIQIEDSGDDEREIPRSGPRLTSADCPPGGRQIQYEEDDDEDFFVEIPQHLLFLPPLEHATVTTTSAYPAAHACHAPSTHTRALPMNPPPPPYLPDSRRYPTEMHPPVPREPNVGLQRHHTAPLGTMSSSSQPPYPLGPLVGVPPNPLIPCASSFTNPPHPPSFALPAQTHPPVSSLPHTAPLPPKGPSRIPTGPLPQQQPRGVRPGKETQARGTERNVQSAPLPRDQPWANQIACFCTRVSSQTASSVSGRSAANLQQQSEGGQASQRRNPSSSQQRQQLKGNTSRLPAVLKTVHRRGPNTGKMYYCCAVGKCRFFQWASSSFPSCTHGLPSIMRQVTKEGPNNGRYFFSCPYRKTTNMYERRRERDRQPQQGGSGVAQGEAPTAGRSRGGKEKENVPPVSSQNSTNNQQPCSFFLWAEQHFSQAGRNEHLNVSCCGTEGSTAVGAPLGQSAPKKQRVQAGALPPVFAAWLPNQKK
uniref:DNA-(apurinic or apyrimidinic site) lyase n=1 Tax=Chromera velia CCMP2878 TaxID=1169474 RepID=A0A0G4G5Q7_9ALVE|eukprot:Cvel_20407.t1-p1 / transcript=Cvel_20407.t1 / gene=Cvel_20407 / organism=Chromera_velia_CCMP2878 / gene_product=Endonuclease 8-like 3, putative / transcript_product=Endonuclease 8-like 3, putative / location=Cvel_scaffold1828:2650-5919(+) / protein_length=867 / sequence_SO=supercontig / SO=protein_coding / is_pseudo=false